jgi:hypothetical protein
MRVEHVVGSMLRSMSVGTASLLRDQATAVVSMNKLVSIMGRGRRVLRFYWGGYLSPRGRVNQHKLVSINPLPPPGDPIARRRDRPYSVRPPGAPPGPHGPARRLPGTVGA